MSLRNNLKENGPDVTLFVSGPYVFCDFPLINITIRKILRNIYAPFFFCAALGLSMFNFNAGL